MQMNRWWNIALGVCFVATPSWAQTAAPDKATPPVAPENAAPPPAGTPMPAPTPNGGAPVAPAPTAVVQPPPPAPPPPAMAGTAVTFGTAPAATPVGNAPLDSGPQPVMGKWATTLYGFAELDVINDSTQSFNDSAGNALIIKDDKYGGRHHRMMLGVRNSRLGFKINAPTLGDIKASAVIEADFLGNQPPQPPLSEAAFWSSPTFRVRHMALKLETPVVDLLAGQYWSLFGWATAFHPATVQIQGVPGQIFSRTAQFRLTKTIKAGDAAVDIAAAAVRPPQRNSEVPDGQAGLKFSYAGLKTIHTAGGAGTNADALAVGVSGVARRFILPEFSAAPAGTPVHRRGISGYGLSVDGLVPIIPATMDKRDNALVLTGSFVTGSGINDLFTGLTGGVSYPAIPTTDPAAMPGTYASADIDPGLVTYDTTGKLHTINWQGYLVGFQYYLPINGKVWISANYSSMKSSNILRYNRAPAAVAGTFDRSFWWDANVFFDLTPAARFGLEYASFNQRYGDLKDAKNERVQFSSWFIF